MAASGSTFIHKMIDCNEAVVMALAIFVLFTLYAAC